MKKVAFVVQRCGGAVNGGAELHCLQLAARMGRYWDVDVLTTCALDYMTWENHYPEGEEAFDGIIIRRFPVDAPRDVEHFNSFSRVILDPGNSPSKKDQEKWLRLQGPNCSKLTQYIKARQHVYDHFIFFTYLYATTYDNLPLVKEKAWLLSTAHDERPIYLSVWDDFFDQPRGFLFNTVEERAFLKKRFPHAALKGIVLGAGVALPQTADPARFRNRHDINAPFLLYIGRIDQSKGVDALFDYFIQFKARQTNDLKLVLMGNPVMALPNHEDIISLGFVDDQDKYDGLSACSWLVNPSPHESLSIVLLEAWLLEKPVLVTEKCDVLVGQCKRANGGLWYRNYAEFEHMVVTVDAHARTIIGRQGHAYVKANYTWDGIAEKLLKVFP